MENENDIYEPVEPNYYSYKAIDCLPKNMDGFLNTNSTINITLCAYEINNDVKYPFIKYLLVKNSIFNILNFIKLYSFSTLYLNTNDIILHTKTHLYDMLSLNTDVIEKDKIENDIIQDTNMEYKGYYIQGNNVYIFYDITKLKVQLNDIYLTSKLWFCILDEIMNVDRVCNIIISKDVQDIFIDNFEFCFLYDKNGNRYNVPIVSYIDKDEKMLNFTYMFGVSKSNKSAILGPYYYFTNYQNALNRIQNKKSVGVVRFALFMENTKYINNFPNDPIDESYIKREKLQDENIDTNIEALTMRISDHDGLWANNYDSIFLGNIDLDNGKMVEDTPYIVVKNYEQQSALSYHYV